MFDGLYAFKRRARCSGREPPPTRGGTTDEMGHPRAPQDRPDRLPLADPQVHRPRRGDRLRPARPGAGRTPSEKARRASTRPGATYTHRGSHCSFETLIEEYKIDDPAIALLARVVHGADVSEDRDATPRVARASSRSPTASHLLERRRPAPARARAAGLRRPLRLGTAPGQRRLNRWRLSAGPISAAWS